MNSGALRVAPCSPSGRARGAGLLAGRAACRPDQPEFINAQEDADHAVSRGIDAIRKLQQGWFEAYPDLHIEPVEIRANGDLVFVGTRFTGHGADRGAAMEMEVAHVRTTEGGRTRRVQAYQDRVEALKAVGLEE